MNGKSIIMEVCCGGSYFLGCLIVVQGLIRVVMMIGELTKVRTRLNGDVGRLLKRTFHCHTRHICLLLFWSGLKVLTSTSMNLDCGRYEFGTYPTFFWMLTDLFLTWWLYLDDCPAGEARALDRLSERGLDYSSCMAHSYYHGYLRIILPPKSNPTEQNLRERIYQFMEEQKIAEDKFPVQSLVVLVPKTGKCHPVLSDDPKIPQEEREDIQTPVGVKDVLRNRAGTESRVYRASTYCIRVRDQAGSSPPLYLYTVAEGATIVQTFRESLERDVEHSRHLREHREDIIYNFSRKVKELIDSSDCKGAEVLYYDDEERDVASVLREFLLRKRAENLSRIKRN